MKDKQEQQYLAKLTNHIEGLVKNGQKSGFEIGEDFSLYAPRQRLARFLVHHELFKKVLSIKGSIIECGVFRGFGLMSWAQLSAVYEPVNYRRKIIGFDTFSGFPDVVAKDIEGGNPNAKRGGLHADVYKELGQAIDLYDANRPLSHIQKVELIRGDFLKTGPAFLKKNTHTIVSLMYLDFDIYQPTKKAIELFLPRMPKGAILAFDEVNNANWPGETAALLEELDLRSYKLEQFPYEPNISYIVL